MVHDLGTNEANPERPFVLSSSPIQPDIFAAATAQDATQKFGQVKVGTMSALGVYRALTPKRDAGKPLTAKEEQQLLDAETALGQKLAFDMEAVRGTSQTNMLSFVRRLTPEMLGGPGEG